MSVDPDTLTDRDYLVMRNVARRFYKRWSLVKDPEHGWCWRRTIGGRREIERCLPGEIEAVDVLDEMGPM